MLNVIVTSTKEVGKFDLTYSNIDGSEIERILRQCERGVRNFYNDHEPFASRWLEQLIEEGLIPQGHVDNRPIRDIEPDDLKGNAQCHFFLAALLLGRGAPPCGRSPRPSSFGPAPVPASISRPQESGAASTAKPSLPEWFRLIASANSDDSWRAG